jgi:hypothetical protein
MKARNCTICRDSGKLDLTLCDCSAGVNLRIAKEAKEAELDAETEFWMREEERAEARATDRAYAIDSQGDDSPDPEYY